MESNGTHMIAETQPNNAWSGRRSRGRRSCATRAALKQHADASSAAAIEAIMRPIDPAQPGTTIPIWLAALAASRCRASGKGENHAVRWFCISGRALYTNGGADTEFIQPLGVSLQGGQTVAVSWMPGESAYTVEVYGGNEHRA
jgi:hypothetical protein